MDKDSSQQHKVEFDLDVKKMIVILLEATENMLRKDTIQLPFPDFGDAVMPKIRGSFPASVL